MLCYATMIGGPQDGGELYLESLPRFFLIPMVGNHSAIYELRFECGDVFQYQFRGVQPTV